MVASVARVKVPKHTNMMSDQTASAADVIRVLSHLLSIAHDGVEGYHQAACAIPVATAPRLHRFLAANAATREEIVSVLTNTLVEWGYKPPHHGSLAGAAHRRWLDLVGKLASDPKAILDECERGEEKMLQAFAHGLGRSLPASVHAVIQSQLARVLTASAALRRVILDLERSPIAFS